MLLSVFSGKEGTRTFHDAVSTKISPFDALGSLFIGECDDLSFNFELSVRKLLNSVRELSMDSVVFELIEEIIHVNEWVVNGNGSFSSFMDALKTNITILLNPLIQN